MTTTTIDMMVPVTSTRGVPAAATRFTTAAIRGSPRIRENRDSEILSVSAPVRASPELRVESRQSREIFEDKQEITTLTEIWARQLVSPQPKLGPVP